MHFSKLANSGVKLILGLTLGLAVAALTAFNILLAWVATGPRSLDVLTPYIEIMFEPVDHQYSVSVGQTWLIWDGWKHPIDIRLRDVKIMTNERHSYSKFPEISLGLDLLGLLRGQMLPTSLTITHPVLSLSQNEDHSITFGLEAESADDATVAASAVPFEAIMAPIITPDKNSSLRALRLISIVDADVNISNKSKGLFFKSSGADFMFRRNREGLHATASATLTYDNYKSVLSAKFTRKKNNAAIEGEVMFSNMMPGTLADLFEGHSLLKSMKFPLSGNAMMTAGMDGDLQKLNFNIQGGEGTLETDKLDGVLPVKSLAIQGTFIHNSNSGTKIIELSKLNADLNGMVVEGGGTVSFNKGDPEIHATVGVKNVSAQQIHLFWPPSLSPVSREWVTSNITEGKVTQAKAVINIAAGDIAKAVLPKEDVDALIVLEGAKIRYLPGHPEVFDVNGKVHVDGVSLEATIDSASYMKDTKLSDGKVLIEDLNLDNPYIKINLAAESTAKDVIRLLELPPLQHAQRLNLLADSAEGKVKGNASLGFHFYAPRDDKGQSQGTPDVDFDIKAELTGVSQAGFMKKFDGKGLDGTLLIDNQALKFKGTGTINGASVSDASVTYLFTPDQGFDTFITATATAPVEVLPRFGYPAFDFLKGVIGVQAALKQGAQAESTQATLDLTQAAISLKTLHIEKPDKIAAELTLTADKKDGLVTIPSFHFKSKEIDAQGSAELQSDLSGIRLATMDKVRVGATSLDRLAYEKTAQGYVIDAHGSTLDLGSWFGDKTGNEEGDFSFEHFPALELKTDISHVLFGAGRELLAVKGNVSCNARHCESANIGGKTADNKPFDFRILRNPKGKRQLSLHAQSAGAFVKALNLFDGMEGGDLTITGNYKEATAGKPSMLRGRMDINEHTVKNASVLAKILSLASLTGFFDTLQGNGIRFTRLSAPFTLANDVITLDKAKTHGDAIGLTAEGSITFPSVRLDIQGTLVPSYSLNNVLGNVPVLGSVFTGGDGQGVFAARYSIGGTSADPKVSVNPLSILTPGFLRGLFDVLDKPKAEPDDEEE